MEELHDELARYIEGQLKPLGWHGCRDYAGRCVALWRVEYGEQVAQLAATRIRKFLHDRRPSKGKSRQGSETAAGGGEGEPGGESDQDVEEEPAAPAGLEGAER